MGGRGDRVPGPENIAHNAAGRRSVEVGAGREDSDRDAGDAALPVHAQLALQYAIAGILAGATDLDVAMPLILETICTHLGRDVGLYWQADRTAEVLHSAGVWHPALPELSAFASLSTRITFPIGDGFPGRVWARGAPVATRDIPAACTAARAAVAATAGLRAAVAFPITAGTVVVGVVECFSRAADAMNPDLERALSSLGSQIGQFVERVRAEAARRDIAQRRASMVETSLDAVITMDGAGQILEFNAAAERIFGYAREHALHRSLAELIIPPEQRAAHRNGLERYLLTGEGPLIGRRIEVTALRADGMFFPAEVAIVSVPHEGPPLFTGYIRDISERRRMEDALRLSEERLRTVVASAPIVLFAVDRHGIFTLSDGAGLAALGIAPDEHVGQSYFALYAHLPDCVAAMERALAGEGATTIDRYRSFVFETRWTPVFDEDGAVSGVIGVSSDITERSRIEEERALSLAREQAARAAAVTQAAERAAVFEAMADGVFTFDRDGAVVRMNRAFAALIGLPPDGESGFAASSIDERGERLRLRDAAGMSLPCDRWPTSRILRGDVLAGGQVEVLIRTVDGRDLLLGMSGAPLRDEDGAIVGGVCVCRDVTEHRRLERQTHAALEALQQMAEAMVQAPADADDPSAATHATALRIGMLTRNVLGCRSVGIIGMTGEGDLQPLECVGLPRDLFEHWRERIAEWPRHTSIFASLRARLRMGEIVPIDTALPEFRSVANPFGIERYLLAPMRVGSTLVGVLSVEYGQEADRSAEADRALVAGVAKLAAVVLEREHLQREREEARGNALALREANRRMNDFLGIAGHEMRTPLTSIKANLQLAQRRLDRLRSDAAARDVIIAHGMREAGRLLDRTEVQVGRITRLVSDIVDVSRIRAGHMEIRRRRADLASVVREVVDEHRQLAPGRSIELLGADSPVEVEIDAERIGQVVINFLTNALKYSHEARTIWVGIAADQGEARVWVRDQGPGLAPEERERVWELFYRVAGVEHRHGSSVGLGMGLHISRTIVHEHGGHVGVESEQGLGATFWFTIPL